MTAPATWFAIGLLAGACVGVFVMALCAVAGEKRGPMLSPDDPRFDTADYQDEESGV